MRVKVVCQRYYFEIKIQGLKGPSGCLRLTCHLVTQEDDELMFFFVIGKMQVLESWSCP